MDAKTIIEILRKGEPVTQACKHDMRVMLNALDSNCGIGIVGECDSGKSHLLSCLLGNDGSHPFAVKANGKEYVFKNEINPHPQSHIDKPTITRFTTYGNNPQLYSEAYPVVARLLSVVDIVIVLCDAYYNGIADWTLSDSAALDEKADEIYSSLHGLPINERPILCADDLLTISLYLKQHIPYVDSINRSSFFERVALVAEYVSSKEELLSIFSILWNNHSAFDRLFTRLVGILASLDYASEVYLPIDAVLHYDVDRNSILSWGSIEDLYQESDENVTDVYVRNKYDNQISKVGTLGKGAVSAVCKEVVFKIEEEYAESPRCYHMDGIAPEVQAMLNKNSITADFLTQCDLLDFPAWSGYLLERSYSLLEDEHRPLYLYQRTKSKYLFDKYNDEHLINALLVCISHRQCSVVDMHRRIEIWVEKNVGKTPEERHRMIEAAEGIAPLFLVFTGFNMDMDFRRLSNQGDAYFDWALYDRFERIALREYFHVDTVEWPKNWTGQGISFQDSYLHRSFRYSGLGRSMLYKGYHELGYELPCEAISGNGYMLEDEYQKMRTLFCNNEAVNKLFDNPALAWDVAASCNNDGSLRIVERLSSLSPHLESLRDRLFDAQLEELTLGKT